MINAKQARSQMTDITAIVQRRQLFDFKEVVAESIKKALNNGQCQVTVTVPEDMDPALVNAFKRVMAKLGYKASLAHKQGYFEDNLYVAPKSTLTVGW